MNKYLAGPRWHNTFQLSTTQVSGPNPGLLVIVVYQGTDYENIGDKIIHVTGRVGELKSTLAIAISTYVRRGYLVCLTTCFPSLNLWTSPPILRTHIHPCLGSFSTSVLSCLAGYPVRCKSFRQQTSTASVAYTLLGGFVVAVGLPCAPPDVQSRLTALKYNLISLVVKERVRCHDGRPSPDH